MPLPEDTLSSLERARERLYDPNPVMPDSQGSPAVSSQHALPHSWGEQILRGTSLHEKRPVRLAGIFFAIAFIFFLVSLGISGYFFYFGGNSVSVDKVTVAIQGPSAIAGGDTVPLALTITNKNSVAIENASIEIDFPSGTRSGDDVLNAYPRYVENLGTLAPGATVTRSVKIVLFGGEGETLALPVSLSYGTAASNSTFVKKSSYSLVISSTPLSISVDTPTEIVPGTPFTFTLVARSNATLPLDNVVLTAAFPFGFSVVSSSVPLNNNSFLLGTLSPNESKTIKLTGTILGQDSEQKTFHFTIGTAKTAQDQALAVTYMTQEAAVSITAPFITTNLALNGDTSANPVIQAGSSQSVSISYTNTLSSSIENAAIAVTISGSAIDYESIRTTNGFYRSSDHAIVFSRDTDSSLSTLAPGASGIGTFTFSTLGAGSLLSSPTITFTTAVSGTRAGQTGVTEVTNTSATKIAKVITTVVLSASSLHTSAPFSTSGPIPPIANQATTYAIVWNVKNEGNAIADGTVTASLPSYAVYTGLTAGDGSFTYNSVSHIVSWNIGDIAQGSNARGSFKVSFTPSTSQKGSAPSLTGNTSFSGHDRFAGVQIKSSAGLVTTETVGDAGYVSTNAIVQ
jgi:hypothetical protein